MIGTLLLSLLIAAQSVALAVLVVRLSRGRTRPPAVEPLLHALRDTSVSIVVPARNEGARIGACLDGLGEQGPAMLEAIVVDGGSTDGTAELVDAASARDPRIRRMLEPPKPPGAVGRPWAIAAGSRHARGEWVLVVDADTKPNAGMTAGAVAAARQHGYDVVSFAPRIVAPTAGARWLQPAFLATLVYRFGPVGVHVADADRTMANGQCLLMRREVLESAGGYAAAANSYCDDIRIVRHLARGGARVGFLDGRRLFDVTMYATGAETWRAWPRSLNMRDATTALWSVLDAILLTLTLALPIPIVLGGLLLDAARESLTLAAGTGGAAALIGINAVLLLMRVLLLVAMRPSFAVAGIAYWLSPLADPAAALRVITTMIQRPREWRGRMRAEIAR